MKPARKRLALGATIDEVTIVEDDNGWASDGPSDVCSANDGETGVGGKGGEGTSTVSLDRTTLALGKVADPLLLQGVDGDEVVLLAKSGDLLLGLWREVGSHLDGRRLGVDKRRTVRPSSDLLVRPRYDHSVIVLSWC